MTTQHFDDPARLALRQEALDHVHDDRTDHRALNAEIAREIAAAQQLRARDPNAGDGLVRTWSAPKEMSPVSDGGIVRNADGSETIWLPKSAEQITAESAAAIVAQLRIQNSPWGQR